MQEKNFFKWQYWDEKLLLKKHENIISFFIRKIYVIVIYTTLSTLVYFWLNYIFSSNFINIVWAILTMALWLWYLYYQYSHSWMIITNKRVIKLIKSSIFITHKRELKLVDIKASLLRKNFLHFLFGFGLIEIQGTDYKSSIYFEWVKPHEDILNYLSKIIDIVKTNPEKIWDIKIYKNRVGRDKRY